MRKAIILLALLGVGILVSWVSIGDAAVSDVVTVRDDSLKAEW